MKNKKILLLLLIFVSGPWIARVSAATPTPSPATPSSVSEKVTENLSDQINNLKEKIASRVAELKLVEKRGTIGVVTEVNGTEISLQDPTGETRVADVDEITKFSSSGDENFGISDIKKGDKISIIGLYNKDSERILARFIATTTIPQFVNGAVTDIDEDNFTVTVTTEEEKEYIVDVEKVTKTLAYSKEDSEEPEKVGFSDITKGMRVHIIGYMDVKEKDRVTATRILTFPDLPKNPKIVIPDQAVDTSKETVTSSGSGKKLTPVK
jgi:hypothetical protein